ncbi:MAG: peroxiredoxin [Candidatus Altiarchaeota archaeon]
MSDYGLEAGIKAPEFCLKDSFEKEVCLKEASGKWVVLYFYPKDNTPGCTIEALDFSSLREEFKKENAVIYGISKDSCQSHQRFIDKQGLTITLLSDPDAEVQKLYHVWAPKKFMPLRAGNSGLKAGEEAAANPALRHETSGVSPKLFMGKEFLGTKRTTYLIDPKGVIRHTWKDVKVKEHAKEVLEKLTIEKSLP